MPLAAIRDRIPKVGALFAGRGQGATLPFAPFEWTIAGRYLRTRRKEGFVSVIALFSFLGIMLGVATLIIVLSVMNGFRKELLSKIVGINGHIFVAPIDRPLTDFADLSDRLGKVAGVHLALPMVEGQAFASSQFGGSGVLVRGVRADDLKKIPSVANTIRGGTLETFDTGGGVAIGKRLAESLGLQAGDTITLATPKGATTPFGTAPRIKSYNVAAVFEVGMSEFDGTFVYMPLTEAQGFFNRDGDVSVIEIFLDNADSVGEARGELERNVMFIILTLIVLVAALNIVSGLIMLVKDKSSDIAILRTMGATRGAIMRVFLITGASIGILGTLAGFALGLVFSANLTAIQRTLFPGAWDPTVRFLSEIPSETNASEVVAVVAMSMVLSLLATLYPSWRAARLDPVQALRYG
jgi:lipoprotein-releasing system permease protein